MLGCEELEKLVVMVNAIEISTKICGDFRKVSRQEHRKRRSSDRSSGILSSTL